MNGRVNEIFAKAGEKHGYEDVEAEFCDYKDFKIKWSRSCKWARFFVSDYLKDAPAEVIEDVAELIMGKIAGEDASYSPESVAWFESKEFIARNQPVFIKRQGSGISEADTKDLYRAYGRLIAKGLVKDDEDIRLFWGKVPKGETGRLSVLMKTVVMNPELPDDKELLEFALYVKLAVIGRGWNPNRPVRCENVAEDYPDASRLIAELAEMGMTV